MLFNIGPRASQWIILTLVLVNIATLATVWLHPAQPRPPKDIARMWQHELGLSDQQTDQVRALVREHRQGAESLFQRMAANKHRMLLALNAAPPDTLLAHQLADTSAVIQRELDLRLQDHYSALRAICTPEQYEKLTRIFLETLQRGAPRPPGGLHHGPPPE